MLRLIFVAILAFSSVDSFKPTEKQLRIFEKELNKTINDMAASLAEKDPLFLPNMTFNLDEEGIKLSLDIKDLTLSGFSKFVATIIKINVLPPSVNVEVVMNRVFTTVAEYDYDLTALFIPFYGKGSFSLVVESITVGASGAASFSPFGVKNLKLTFSLAATNMQVTGLFHNEALSQIVSAASTECFPIFIKNYSPPISKILAPIIENAINSALAGESKLHELH